MLLCSLLFRQRLTLLFCGLVYSLSGIGLWQGAWFYFQEFGTLFFLLAALLSYLQRPSLAHGCWVLGALLIQIASANYWTVYNAPFALLLLGAFAFLYPKRVRAALITPWRGARRAPGLALVLAVPLVLTTALWGATLAEASAEVATYVRPGTQNQAYTAYDALDITRETSAYVLGLFNPSPGALPEGLAYFERMHYLRYLGGLVLPLLAALPLLPWRRREVWLLGVAVGTLIIALAPPPLLRLWEATPFLDRVRHFFHFYTHFWQLAVLWLSAGALDRLLRMSLSDVLRQRLNLVWSGLAVGAGVGLTLAFLWADTRTDPRTIEAWVLFCLLLGANSVLLARLGLARRAYLRQSVQIALLVLLAAELSNYFWQANHLDHHFTQFRWTEIKAPLPGSITERLSQPWLGGEAGLGFGGGLAANMPVPNDFWPENDYLVPGIVAELLDDIPAWREVAYGYAPLTFFPLAQVETAPETAEIAGQVHDPTTGPRLAWTLLVHDHPAPAEALADPGPTPATPEPFNFQFLSWAYNRFTIEVAVPQAGWVVLHQLHDPNWQLRVNDAERPFWRANQVNIALPLAPGTYQIRLDYQPAARTLYWLAVAALQATLLLYLLLGLLRRATIRRFFAIKV
ncbi:MAG: hypothetical protein HC915_14645 [Anaerolineae bacterium]|nr:hypothetical protein [Anaerolineae bacterium]